MSVCTSTFGGVRLSKEDAKKFKDQLTYGKPKKAAVESYSRGRELAKTFAAKGYVVLKKA